MSGAQVGERKRCHLALEAQPSNWHTVTSAGHARAREHMWVEIGLWKSKSKETCEV